MSYFYDQFFIFSLIFIVTNHINLIKTDALVSVHVLEYLPYYFWMITWLKKANNFQIAKAQARCCLAFA